MNLVRVTPSPPLLLILALITEEPLDPPSHTHAGTFNILAYTSSPSPDATSDEIPADWQPSDAHLIDPTKVEQVRLRSFSTNVHKLEALVAYKLD